MANFRLHGKEAARRNQWNKDFDRSLEDDRPHDESRPSDDREVTRERARDLPEHVYDPEQGGWARRDDLLSEERKALAPSKSWETNSMFRNACSELVLMVSPRAEPLAPDLFLHFLSAMLF